MSSLDIRQLSFFESVFSFRSGISVQFWLLNTEDVVVLWKKYSKKHIILKKTFFDCWDCISHGTDKDGYPKVDVSRTTRRMHRFIYCLFRRIPWSSLGECLRHTCDNRLCVNPKHMLTGTRADNALDMIERDRSARGVRNAASKLSEFDVAYIRSSTMDSSYIADVLGVCVETVRRVRRGDTWKDC